MIYCEVDTLLLERKDKHRELKTCPVCQILNDDVMNVTVSRDNKHNNDIFCM